MSTIEEQLWDYIDGNCSAEEKAAVEAKLASDVAYSTTYAELMTLTAQMGAIDFEEPSMSFTRNVMGKVSTELKPVALKTKVDNRIIYGIGGFFVISILALFTYAVINRDLSFSGFSLSFNMQEMITPTTLKAFLFVDLAIALVFLDIYIRRKKKPKTRKASL